MQAKGAVSFIEPPHLFSAVPVPLASPAFPYSSLPQSDSREGEGDDLFRHWFPSLVHLPVKRDEDTTRADNFSLLCLKTQVCLPAALALSALHVLAQSPPPVIPSHPHTSVARKADFDKET